MVVAQSQGIIHTAHTWIAETASAKDGGHWDPVAFEHLRTIKQAADEEAHGLFCRGVRA